MDSTLDGERVAMGIDPESFAHIMGVLTDLYSDPELAVLREYSTNALDSHIDAKVKRPIEVTLPSPLSPFLRIRDFGIGLDAEDIRNVYSRYGTSTKRDSNDVVGMLGLGCKSALTYADQFTVTGYKNGKAVQVSVSRDEDGAGSMTLVAEHASNEHGVEVVIPAKRHNDFENKAQHFFSFWKPGTVLVNGEAPDRIDGIWIDDKMLAVRGHDLDEDYIVMGNVPYPWPADEGEDSYRYNRRSYRKVVFVEIGEVQFTPSREALQMTKLTKETLARCKAEFAAKLDASLTAQIAGAASAQEAIEKFVEAQGMGLSTTAQPTFQGRPVDTKFTRPHLDRWTAEGAGYLVATPNAYRGRKGGEWHQETQIMWASGYGSVGSVENTLWFENFEGKELTLTKRNKLDYYLTQKGVQRGNRRIVCVKEFTDDEKFWLGGTTVYDFTEVDAVNLPREERKNEDGRPKGAYKGRAPGETTWHKPILAEKIDTSKPIFWIHGNHYTGQGDYAVRQGIIPADAYIICLDANRIEKFKRDFPTAEGLREGAIRLCKEWVETQDKVVVRAARFQMNGQPATKLRPLDPAKVNDPQLVECIKLAKTDATSVIKGFESRSRWITGRDSDLLKPVTKYPLIEYAQTISGKQMIDHVYLYLNAAYTAAQKGTT